MADFNPNVNGADQLLTQMKTYYAAVQDTLRQEVKETVQSMTLEMETLVQQVKLAATKPDLENAVKRMNEISTQMTQMANDQKANQTVIDNFVIEQQKKSKEYAANRKDFQSAWGEDVVSSIKDKQPEIEQTLNDVHGKFKLKLRPNRMNLEEKGIMTVSNTLTGTGAITFNQRQGIVPAQKINFRDMLRTVSSGPNGLYVTWRETNAVQAVGKQSDGSAKANLQYTFQAVTATLAYIAGFVTLTRQVMFNLPFLEQTLPTILLRDFYKKENDYLFTTMAGNSTGTYVGSGTVDAEELLNTILSQLKANFNASAGIVDFIQLGRLLTTKPNDYSIPGGFYMDANGVVRVLGTPIVAASWAQTDHVLVFDSDFYERVEGDSLAVTFSYENQDNFEKNQVTARIECFEELNRLRDDASIYRDFGNS